MTGNENSAPRTSVVTSVDFKSQRNQIKVREAVDLGTFNLAQRAVKNCRDMPNNSHRFGTLPETGYIRQSQLIPQDLPVFLCDPLAEGEGGTRSSSVPASRPGGSRISAA